MQAWQIRPSNNYLIHHGIKGQKWGVKNGPPYPLKDCQLSKTESIDKRVKRAHTKDDDSAIVAETIRKSVGAKSRNYDVWNPVLGENMHFAEGTRITQPKNHVIAGKGRNRQIDCEDWLNSEYAEATPGEWTKEKGFGYVEDDYGDRYKVEVHWYQNPTVGKVEFKIKETPGGEWFIEDV